MRGELQSAAWSHTPSVCVDLSYSVLCSGQSEHCNSPSWFLGFVHMIYSHKTVSLTIEPVAVHNVMSCVHHVNS